jgi:hypothetical protein
VAPKIVKSVRAPAESGARPELVLEKGFNIEGAERIIHSEDGAAS